MRLGWKKNLWFICSAPFVSLLLLPFGPYPAALFLFVSHVLLLYGIFRPTAQTFGAIKHSFHTNVPEIWLTFDDGPTAHTIELLDLLDEAHAKATFFVIGERAAAYPGITAQIIARGHSLGNHTQTHPASKFWRLGPRCIAREIDCFEQTLHHLGLAVPALFRVPAGFKNPFLPMVARARQLLVIAWSARAYDTRDSDHASVLRKLRPRMKPGSIILLHEGTGRELAVLRALLAVVEERGLCCVIPQPAALLPLERD